jgi:hypothetical protein
MSERKFTPQKVISTETQGHTAALRLPDSFQVTTRIVGGKDVLRMQTASRNDSMTGLDGEKFSESTMVVVAINPPVPHRVITIGGGRPIGGGTSKEAIARAKKKAKRQWSKAIVSQKLVP